MISILRVTGRSPIGGKSGAVLRSYLEPENQQGGRYEAECAT